MEIELFGKDNPKINLRCRISVIAVLIGNRCIYAKKQAVCLLFFLKVNGVKFLVS
jgi:hypothetical protein